jgi:hypothetical protein
LALAIYLENAHGRVWGEATAIDNCWWQVYV